MYICLSRCWSLIWWNVSTDTEVFLIQANREKNASKEAALGSNDFINVKYNNKSFIQY